MMSPSRIALVLFVVLASACSLADPSYYEALADGALAGTDGGPVPDRGMGVDVPPGVDGGPGQLSVDACGAMDVFVIRETRQNIQIDTRTFRNDISSLPGCSNLSVGGNEGFLAVEVQAGEEWHFHLRVDGAVDPDPTSRNPTLYVLNDSCSATMCREDLLANFCAQSQDEHFAYTFPAAGRFWIAIDDRTAGGGVYLLDAVRPVCGDGMPVHGEACEGDPTCGDDCRWELSDASRQERGFNFNFKEANRIVLPPVNELEIQGDIGGFEGCSYPDVFAIDVPPGALLEVIQHDRDSMPCMATGAPDLTITLRNAANDLRGGDVSAGCAFIDETLASGGLFFVRVEDNRFDTSSVLAYRLNFRLTPP